MEMDMVMEVEVDLGLLKLIRPTRPLQLQAAAPGCSLRVCSDTELVRLCCTMVMTLVNTRYNVQHYHISILTIMLFRLNKAACISPAISNAITTSGTLSQF